jgi:hypothetical protein
MECIFVCHGSVKVWAVLLSIAYQYELYCHYKTAVWALCYIAIDTIPLFSVPMFAVAFYILAVWATLFSSIAYR